MHEFVFKSITHVLSALIPFKSNKTMIKQFTSIFNAYAVDAEIRF